MIVISKLNLGAGEMGLMFCDLYAFARDINSKYLPCLSSVLLFCQATHPILGTLVNILGQFLSTLSMCFG